MTISHLVYHVARVIDDLLSFRVQIIEAESVVDLFSCFCCCFSRQWYRGSRKREQTCMTPTRLRAGCSIR